MAKTGTEEPKTAGLALGDARTDAVGEYPPRPYAEAVTAEHLALLKAAGQAPA